MMLVIVGLFLAALGVQYYQIGLQRSTASNVMPRWTSIFVTKIPRIELCEVACNCICIHVRILQNNILVSPYTLIEILLAHLYNICRLDSS